MRTTIAIATVLAASGANAAPVYLSCPGTWHLWGVLEEVSKQPGTLAITVDVAKMTASTGENEVYRIDRLSDDVLVVSDLNLQTGVHVFFTLNRITGALRYSTWAIKTYPRDFEGICKPAQK